jgi:hypothetical protein
LYALSLLLFAYPASSSLLRVQVSTLDDTVARCTAVCVSGLRGTLLDYKFLPGEFMAPIPDTEYPVSGLEFEVVIKAVSSDPLH